MRYSSSFALGYLVVGIIRFFVAMFLGAIEFVLILLKLIFSELVAGIDSSRHDAFHRSLEQAALPYLPVLAAKRAKLYRPDDYGVMRPEKWAKELNYFIHDVLIPHSSLDSDYIKRNLRTVANDLDSIISEHRAESAGPVPPLKAIVRRA
jgi:hypothetical protein